MTAFYWHGAAMALAWLVLMPAGALIARFWKVRPGRGFPERLDDRWWWNAHRGTQIAGAGLSGLAVWWAWDALGETIDWQAGHVQLGVVTLSLTATQLLSPFLRGTKGGPTDLYADPADPLTWRGDHYDMTFRRRLFEAWHKGAGYGALGLAVCAVWTGIEAAGLPLEWRWGVVLAIATFGTLFLRWSRGGRRVDTWLAIWGPDGR